MDDGPPRPYRVRAPHPLATLATRAALWGAVVVGAVGGVVGLVRPPVQQVEAGADADAAERGDVPAPVAGTAELVVEAWLTAGDDDTAAAGSTDPGTGAEAGAGDPATSTGTGSGTDERAALADLFLDEPARDDLHRAALTVEDVATVAGEQRAAGYWAVTVKADIVEEVAVEAEGAEDEQAIEQLAATWYLEVAIVGDVDSRLVALTTPAVVPAPAGEVAEWQASLDPPRDPGDGPLAETVEGFLAALLAEGGDPTRYLAPGGEIDALDPAPFVDLELVAVAAEEYEDGQTRVLAEVLVTTPGGSRTRLTYELMLGEWADRWEVTRFSGAPSVVIAPAPAAGDDAEADTDEADADEADTDGHGSDDEPDRDAEADRATTTTTAEPGT